MKRVRGCVPRGGSWEPGLWVRCDDSHTVDTVSRGAGQELVFSK